MQINEVKDLISQFDGSSLREFSYTTNEFTLAFSKNNGTVTPSSAMPLVTTENTPALSAEVSV
ncbi:MAG: acetyl-CoA carboxylase biotin carboxyl carrier protein, partial [Lactococcus raffinolactis]